MGYNPSHLESGVLHQILMQSTLRRSDQARPLWPTAHPRRQIFGLFLRGATNKELRLVTQRPCVVVVRIGEARVSGSRGFQVSFRWLAPPAGTPHAEARIVWLGTGKTRGSGLVGEGRLVVASAVPRTSPCVVSIPGIVENEPHVE